jgi:hypothetical protein
MGKPRDEHANAIDSAAFVEMIRKLEVSLWPDLWPVARRAHAERLAPPTAFCSTEG